MHNCAIRRIHRRTLLQETSQVIAWHDQVLNFCTPHTTSSVPHQRKAAVQTLRQRNSARNLCAARFDGSSTFSTGSVKISNFKSGICEVSRVSDVCFFDRSSVHRRVARHACPGFNIAVILDSYCSSAAAKKHGLSRGLLTGAPIKSSAKFTRAWPRYSTDAFHFKYAKSYVIHK